MDWTSALSIGGAFAAGQLSIIGIEVFRHWITKREHREEAHWQRRIASLNAFQDDAVAMDNVLETRIAVRFRWIAEFGGEEPLSSEIQAETVVPVYKAINQLRRNGIATRSDTINAAFHAFDEYRPAILSYEAKTESELSELADNIQAAIVEMLFVAEREITAAENRQFSDQEIQLRKTEPSPSAE